MAGVFESESHRLGDDYLGRLLRCEEFWALAATVDDAIVGGVTAYTLPQTRAEVAELFIYDVAVVPAWQRRGVGRQLMATLRMQAAHAGVGVAFVPADNDDTHALDFYRALGGAPTPVTLFTFGEPCA
jgi:aminoglycoside 3-N-acetyltransferase I